MMIYCQNRKKVIRVGKEIYIKQILNDFQVVSMSNSKVTVLGEYDDEDFVEEILKTLFQHIRCKKSCYAMPTSRSREKQSYNATTLYGCID